MTGRHLVVCGFPGSGKSTYVEDVRQDGDILFDLDELSKALNPDFQFFCDRPSDISKLVVGFRDELVRRIRENRIGNRRVITIVMRERTEKILAKQIGAELVVCPKADSYE